MFSSAPSSCHEDNMMLSIFPNLFKKQKPGPTPRLYRFIKEYYWIAYGFSFGNCSFNGHAHIEYKQKNQNRCITTYSGLCLRMWSPINNSNIVNYSNHAPYPGKYLPNTTHIATKAISRRMIQFSGSGTFIQSNRNLTSTIIIIAKTSVIIIVMEFI